MRKKIICGIVVMVILISGLILSKGLNNNNRDISVNFSELSLGEDKLVEKADAIVLGKLIEKKSAKTETIAAKKKGDADIVWTYCTYDLEVNEIVAGNVPNSIDIIFAGSNKLEDIELDKDYVWFLEKDMLGDNKYHLLSYSEGIFEIEKSEKQASGMLFSNKKTGIKFDKDTLIKKVKESKK